MKTISKVLSTTIVGTALFGMSGLTAVAAADNAPASATKASEPAAGTTVSIDNVSDADTVITPIDPDQAQRYATADQDEEMRAEYTRGFDLTNLSGNVLRVNGYIGKDPVDDLPALGTVVPSGGTTHLEIAWLWMQTHDVRVNFDVLNPQGQVIGNYGMVMRVHSQPMWTEQSSWGFTGGLGAAWGGGQEQYYGDAKDQVINLPAGQGQAQADVLNRICTAGQATCTFTPTSRDENAWTGQQQIGDAWGNERTTPYTKEFTASKSIELTQSVEVGASVKLTIAKIFEASISAKYSTGSKTSETYTDKTTLTVQPGTMTWPVGNFPVITDTGDFTVQMGNTTWNLTGVTFTHPDPSRHAVIIWKEAPVGSAPVGSMHQLTDTPTVINT